MKAQKPPLGSDSKAKIRPNIFSGISADISNSIAQGTLAPGSKLPTRKELAARYKTTIATVQKALTQVEEAGLVASHGWRGTFVSAAPPCLYRYAILLPERLAGKEGSPGSLYLHALANAAQEQYSAQEIFRVYEGLAEPTGGDLPTLLADVANHAIAGLICVNIDPRVHPALATAIEARHLIAVDLGPHLPRVSPWMVAYDYRDLFSKVLGTLKERGCRRPAVAFNLFSVINLELLQASARAAGLDLPDGYTMGFHQHTPLWPRHWIRLLMGLPPDRRPDGVYIGDDHLGGAICEELSALGILPDSGMPVISHAHVNLPPLSRTPGVTYCGFDLRQALLTSARLINEARTSTAPGRMAGVPASILAD